MEWTNALSLPPPPPAEAQGARASSSDPEAPLLASESERKSLRFGPRGMLNSFLKPAESPLQTPPSRQTRLFTVAHDRPSSPEEGPEDGMLLDGMAAAAAAKEVVAERVVGAPAPASLPASASTSATSTIDWLDPPLAPPAAEVDVGGG